MNLNKKKVSQSSTKKTKSINTLKPEEQILSGIIESMTDIIIMIDEDRNVCWANRKAKNVLGKKIIGKKCYEVYHDAKKACGLCLSKKAFQDGNFHEKETKIIDKKGQTRDVWSTVNIVTKHKNGSPKFLKIVSSVKTA